MSTVIYKKGGRQFLCRINPTVSLPEFYEMACKKCKKRKELEDKFLKHLEENVQKVFEDPKWKQDVLKVKPCGHRKE